MIKNSISNILFSIGITLISLNLVGLFIDLRNEDIYHEKINNGFGLELTIKEFYSELDKVYDNSKLSDSTKIIKTTELVNKGLVYYWRDEGISKYNLTIPIYENYLLFLSRFIYPKIFKKYEFLDWQKALERGVGLSSQFAIIESEILNENGINSKIILLSGHIVVMTQYNSNNWMIVDPRYGVNIPFDITFIQNNVDIIEEFYIDKGYDSATVTELKENYKEEGNFIIKNADVYKGRSGIVESISYWLIWIIPITLITPYFKRKLYKIHSKE